MLQIIYSTEKGQTKTVAGSLFSLLKAKNISISEPISTKDIMPAQVNSDFVYLTSTFFDGDHPSSANRGMNFFAESEEFINNFNGKKYAVFGIGSSRHEKHNYAAIDADNIFMKLGGQRMIQLYKFDRASKESLEDYLSDWASCIIEKFK
ncbi:Flavodoxin [Spironucleus salmonicida]|uniref:Flavodoxin n=1 Tax=Spironucleus salmonicida TaxID=348837 RepID=V6LWF5_9EUKA|nr:Flavodoxin [Spironucleus salmonicida]|eukprot:EST45144.1 Flavodoxin [Spironucleus salmonicida]